MERFSGLRLLVVGGAGFVGANLSRALLKEAALSVTVVDNFLSAERKNLPQDSRLSVIEGSIADDLILSSLQDEFDYVFHVATYHGNQSSIHDPIADHDNNTITTLKLFERLKNFKSLKKIVYTAAGCSVAKKTYGEAEATEETDLVSLDMDSPYSMSKVFGEFYSVYYFNQHKLPVVRARFQNVYGPGEVLGAGKWRGTPATVWRNVTPTFIYKSLKKEALPLENNGESTRDFIFVDDVVEGLITLALSGKSGDVYNLASGVETSIRELAEKINSLTENPTATLTLPRRSWDKSGCRYGSPIKSKRELGFETKINLQQGLEITVEWFKENLNFIESCMQKHADKM